MKRLRNGIGVSGQDQCCLEYADKPIIVSTRKWYVYVQICKSGEMAAARSRMADCHLSEQQQIAVILLLSPMGQGLVGYTAAAQACFRKPLAQLNTGESAFLAALGKAPSRHVSLCRLKGR